MKIAITRLKDKDTDDSSRCLRLGHDCYSVSPLISEINQDTIDDFIRDVKSGSFDCIFFSSALPAARIAPLLSKMSLPRVVAIGPQTAKVLRSHGILCEILPKFYSHAFVPYLGEWIKEKDIGLPRANVPNQNLIGAITDAGGTPHEYPCYRLIPTHEELDLSSAEALLFTSAFSFTSAIWRRRTDLILLAIGDTTAAAMLQAGLTPDVVGDGSLEGTLKELNMYMIQTEL
ncbi:MAG: uroporphyrinogen-III synthase [Methanospirillaceae archaeon]|nr:uroporphyrinogen-III synthase [Methanospirillaceae archaeon]